ncbi:DUF397 domain-containing protein [Streptomyces sp. NPDC049954]|uniref:DUF397 domain-containing protein n=1 Tax=Streptomyces sp. NPDC049954 TaxID=3155779 RepID=UPI00342DCCC5
MNAIPNSAVSGLVWTKSSYSGGNNDCVETAAGQLVGRTPVRDSKNPTGPALCFPELSWDVFVAAVKADSLA